MSVPDGKPREVKVVLLGDTGVGKSSLVLRFVTNNFKPYSESTIGASFMSKIVTVDGKQTKFQIWDTAGQEKYHSLARKKRKKYKSNENIYISLIHIRVFSVHDILHFSIFLLLTHSCTCYPSQPCTIEAPQPLFWCTISPALAHSRLCAAGWTSCATRDQKT